MFPELFGFLKYLADRLRGKQNKEPPLVVTSAPVKVADIWQKHSRKKSIFSSLVIHAVGIVFVLSFFKDISMVRKAVHVFLPGETIILVPVPAKGGGGGGGDRSPIPANKGKLPRQAPKQFVPPTAAVQNENPKLILEPTVVVPSNTQLPQSELSQFGDPLGKLGISSSGPGSGGGIGKGRGGGVGPGSGPGVGPGSGGGFGGEVFKVGNGVTDPIPTFMPNPEYSDEARKAKFEGTVVLTAEVNARGIVQNIKVFKSLGLGLDEKAIEAVSQWRFRPGLKNGKPVTVAVTIEVNFRLL